MRTIVVVPTYEEAANIAELLQRIRAAAPDVDVLVVDDNSPDGTAKLAEALNEELGHVDVLVRNEKAGLGTAYRAGFAIGIERGYDVIVQMDADLSHDPASIPPLVGALSDDVGLVIGSRYIPGGHIPHWPWYRRFLSRYGNLYTRIALGLKARDLDIGVPCVEGEHAPEHRVPEHQRHRVLVPDGDGLPRGRRGEGIAEVPITFTDRVRGVSKMSGAVIVEELTRVTWWGIRDRVDKLRRRPTAQ